jgi:ATP-binding cassette subfamily B protein
MKTSQIFLLSSLWNLISKKRKKQFILLFLVSVASSFAELVSIATVIPFLIFFSAPEKLTQNKQVVYLIDFFPFINPSNILFFITAFFCFSIFVSFLIRIFFLWLSTKLAFATGAELSMEMYRKTLYQPYLKHISQNSSEIIDTISSKANAIIYNAINPAISIATSLFLLITISATLFIINPIITIVIFLVFSSVYFLITKLTHDRLSMNSKKISYNSTQSIKALQEGLGGIRDILIDRSQEVFCNLYKSSDSALRKAQASNQFIILSPRYFIEAIGMILIILIAFFLNRLQGPTEAFVTIGVFAIAAQRILPSLQQIYSSWSTLKGSQSSLYDAINLLNQSFTTNDPLKKNTIKFKNQIEIKNAFFRYNNKTPWIIKDVNLKIQKGTVLGFIGKTGSGKSTLLDIFMGLLPLTKGEIKVDGKLLTLKNFYAWQKYFAHVPQMIYLTDSSIAENIAFGIPSENIDMNKVIRAAKLAHISDTINSWENKYETVVGERGIKLSGGQRQRIGIARALYKDAEVIIFDEATSSLDDRTESLVMDSINKLSKKITIIIVAHRLSTLKKCKTIFEVKNSRIFEAANF